MLSLLIPSWSLTVSDQHMFEFLDHPGALSPQPRDPGGSHLAHHLVALHLVIHPVVQCLSSRSDRVEFFTPPDLLHFLEKSFLLTPRAFFLPLRL